MDDSGSRYVANVTCVSFFFIEIKDLSKIYDPLSDKHGDMDDEICATRNQSGPA